MMSTKVHFYCLILSRDYLNDKLKGTVKQKVFIELIVSCTVTYKITIVDNHESVPFIFYQDQVVKK